MKGIPKKQFLLIFLTIIVINFGYALIYNIKPAVDAEAYDEIALNIINKGEYRASENTPITLDGAITRIGPGYEIFVAGHYFTFGKHLWIIWLTQSILYALTILMLEIITIGMFPNLRNNMKLVYAVMIFFGIFIDIVQLNGMLMTESLFLFMLVLCFFTWFRTYKMRLSNKWEWWIILGALLGLLTLIRPTGLIIFILLSITALYIFKKEGIKYVIFITCMFVLIQMPWIIRNYNIYNKIIFHSAADGLNIFSGNYPGNHGEFNANFPLYKELKEKYPSPIAFNTATKEWYRNFVIHHPIKATKVIAEKILVFFSLAKTSGFWFHYFGKIDQIPTILISALENFIILGCIIFYLIYTLPKIKNKTITPKEIFILVSFIVLSLTPILTVIANRHRLPLAIMSLPIVIYVLDIMIQNYKIHLKNILIVVCIIILSTSIDIYLQFNKFKTRLQRVDKTSYLDKIDYYA